MNNSRGRWLLATGVAWLVFGVVLIEPAAARQEVSAALRDRVAQLLERLESDDADRQAQAEEALIKLGPDVLSLLPEPTDAPAELKERLDRIRTALADQAEAIDFGGSRVTIKGKGIRLSEALRELQRQTGNRITDLRELYGQDATNPALDLEIEDRLFFEALDELAEKAGLSLVFYTGDGTIGLTAGEAMGYGTGVSEAPRVFEGPFRIELQEIVTQYDFATGARAANTRFEVAWEPRLRPMLLTLEAEDVTIRDDRGAPVEPTVSEEAGSVVLRPESPVAELNLNMNAPPRDVRTLATVRVEASVTVPAANKVFRFDLGEGRAAQEQENVRVEYRGLEIDGFVWKVDVEVGYEGESEAFESYRQGLFNNEIWLERPDGSRFRQNGGFNQIGGTDRSMVFQYLFVDVPGDPEDYRLAYETPGAVEEIPLEFEFKDVPLP